MEKNKNKIADSEKEIKQEIKNDDKLIKELKNTNDELTSLLVEKQNHIDQLKSEIKKFNEEFKNQVALKANQASQVIQAKTAELEQKMANEINYAKKYAIESQALEIINIVNQFELALSYTPKNPEVAKYQNGFKMFLTMLNNLLKELNIDVIKPEIGQEFDSKIMECFETVSDKKFKDDEIVVVIGFGYKLFDHILKPALVKVNKV